MAQRRKPIAPPPEFEALFRRVAAILDQARESLVRFVNSEMILAYWHIGREMVQTLQGGDERAEYGRRLVADLSGRLTARYGRGFSTTNLWYFRQFYLAYADRDPRILHKPCGESAEGDNPTIGLILCAEKNETIAKYSVLAEGRQVFAAKYVKHLPTEEELRRELERERHLVELRSAVGKKKE